MVAGRCLDVGEDATEKTRLPRVLVRGHWHMGDCHAVLPSLDDRFKRVGEVRHDRLPQRRFAGIGAEAAGRVWHVCIRDLSDNPAAYELQPPLEPRHVPQRADVAVADHDVGLATEQRGEELADIPTGVLVVRVGVDDEIGVEFQGCIDAGHEGGGQPLV